MSEAKAAIGDLAKAAASYAASEAKTLARAADLWRRLSLEAIEVLEAITPETSRRLLDLLRGRQSRFGRLP